MTDPTSETYKTLQSAYEFFNQNLFENKLPTCLITMQRKGKAKGYFSPERFQARKEESFYTHEIAMNPAYFRGCSDEDIISTLVHEMCHVWQQEFGKPGRGNYHNSEWADKMEDIGLIPSNTGEEGGARVGTGMTHYIDKDGRFTLLCAAFLESHQPLNYQDRATLKPATKNKNKVKYTCPKCSLKAWGKSGIKIMCGEDAILLVENSWHTFKNVISS